MVPQRTSWSLLFPLKLNTAYIWMALLLCYLVFAYLPALQAPLFSLDDSALLGIPQLRTPVSFRSLLALFKVDSNIDFYPVRDLSYILDSVLWPGSLVAARLHQLTLFWLCSLLSVAILLELRVRRSLAFAVPALWLLHPFHAETMMWLSARKDVLALFFGLSGALLFLRGVRLSRALCYVAAVGTIVLSLLSKASLTLVPLALLPCVFMHFEWLRSRSARWALILVAGIAFLLGLGQAWFYSHVNSMQIQMGTFERVALSGSAFGRAMSGWLIPSLNVVDNDTFGQWLELNRAFAPIGYSVWGGLIALAIFALIRRDRPLLIWLMVLVAMYLPVSGLLFPHRSLYSTRYFEPFSLVLFMLMAFSLSRLCSRAWLSRMQLSAGVLLALLLVSEAYGTCREARGWEDGVAIREKALASEPKSLSLKGYLLGELINAIGHVDPETRRKLTERRNRLVSELEPECTRLAEAPLPREPKLAGCMPFFSHGYHLSLWRGDTAKADQYFEYFARSSEEIRPEPRNVQRFRLERKLKEGKLEPRFYEEWLTDTKFFPNSDYRLLRLALLCILGNPTDQAMPIYQGYLLDHLIGSQEIALFLEGLDPGFRAIVRKCLASE